MKIGKYNFDAFPAILAPMEDITDPPFRKICKKYGADIMYSEFISSEGLIRDAHKSKVKLLFEETERPFGIQIFGHNVESMIASARIVEEYQPDVIDINFGCPVRKVVSKGAGAAMLKTPDLMLEITKSVVEAVKIPVSVKTRLGWDKEHIIIQDLAPKLQDCGIAALSIHGRTASQLYGGSADWNPIGEVKSNPEIQIPIIGNGDINSAEIAIEMQKKHQVDGIMIGRAATGNPWIFSQIKKMQSGQPWLEPKIDERVNICSEHIKLSIDYKGESRTIKEMRKFYTGYFKGLINIKSFRMRLLTSNDLNEVFDILEEIRAFYSKSNGVSSEL